MYDNPMLIFNSLFLNLLKYVGSGPVDGDPCGLDQPLVISNSQSGEIKSPDHPNDYPVDVDCTWHIEAGVGETIAITFDAFELEEE